MGQKKAVSSPPSRHEVRQSDYRFISPLLECEVGEELGSEFVLLRQLLKKLISDEVARGTVSHVSL